jgi:hypothetical protein
MTRIRSRLTYANVMASVAVFAALGGGAFAASIKAKKDSVVSSSIKNGKVKSADIRDNGVGGGDIADGAVGGNDIADGAVGGAELADGAVGGAELADGSVGGTKLANGSVDGAKIADGEITGADVADDSLLGADVDESTFGVVPEADQLDGREAADFFRYGGWVPPGETITGVWGGREYGADNPLIQEYSFPLPARLALGDNDVNFGANGAAGSIGNDDDPSCTGTNISPTAPPGKVCIYVSGSNLLASSGTALGEAGASGRRGFQVRGPSHAVGDVEVHGSWAYTGE